MSAMVSSSVTHPAPVWCDKGSEVSSPDIESGAFSGKTILIVPPGAAGRKRVLNRILRAGCRVVIYNTNYNWAHALLPNTEDWIIGPLDDLKGALEAVQSWLLKQECNAVTLKLERNQASELGTTAEFSQPTHDRGAQQSHESTNKVFDGVMCYDEYGLHLASVLAQSLGLPFMTPQIVKTLRNKHHFRHKCKEGGVPCPRFMRITKQPDKQRLADLMEREQVRFPVVAKPSACAGSFAVLKAHDMTELSEAVSSYYSSLPAYLDSVGLGPTSDCATGGMVVEELVVGKEVDIDCVVYKGQLLFASVSDNHDPCSPVHATSFVERGGRCPSTLPPSKQEALFDMAAAIFRLWGDQLSGVFHLEAFSTAHGPVPIELNARMGGAETFTNIKAVWGVDLAEQALRCALGLPPQLPTLLDAANTIQESVSISVPVSDSNYNVAGVSVDSHVAGCQEQQDDCSSADEPVLSDTEVFTEQNDVALQDMWAMPLAENSKSTSCEQLMQQSHSSSQTPEPFSCISEATQRMQEITVTDCDNQKAVATRPESKVRCDGVDSHIHAVGIHAVAAWRLPVGHEIEDCTSCASSHRNLAHDGASSHAGTGYDSDSDSPDVTPPESIIFASELCGAQEQAFISNTAAARRDLSPLQPATFPTPCIPGVMSTSPGVPAGACTLNQLHVVGQDSDKVSHTRIAHPLYHVHSVNFVPDWEGLGVIDVLGFKPGAEQHRAYVDSQMYNKPGDLVRLPPLGFSALGWMVARGLDPQHAEHEMQVLMDLVDIQLHKP